MHATLARSGNNAPMSNSDGDRILGPELVQRREALRLTPKQFAAKARISARALNYAEQDPPRAGKTVAVKIRDTLLRLEAGEQVEDTAHVLRMEFRPGVWVTVDAENVATIGDLRDVEEKIRRLADNGR